jgi:PAS domain S-box-containing protein
MRLRGQYTIVIGGLVCSGVLVLGAVLLAEQRRYAHEVGMVAADSLGDSLERQIEKHGIALASSLAQRLVTPLYHNDYKFLAAEAAEQRSHPDVLFATIVDDSGVMVRDGEALDDETEGRMEHPWVTEALATGKPTSLRDGGTLHVAAPAIAGGHVLGAVVLDLSMDGIRSDIQIEKARLNGLIRSQSTSFSLTGIALGIVLVTLAILSAFGVAGRLSRPVVAFAARARRIGRGEPVESKGSERRDEIGDLARAFDEMAEALRRTTVSKEYFDSVLQSMADMLLVTDQDGRVVTANASCLAELGCREEDLRGRSIESLLPGPTPASAPLLSASDSSQWFALHSPGGTEIPVRVAAAPLRTAGGTTTGYVFVMQNVAERLAAEKQIERSLVEKEILLREIHHRVKNNLQIISSMLSLQGERTSDGVMREVFQESEIRIRAMALVHEQLYRSGDLARVDLARYLDTLTQQVLRYFGRAGDCRAEVRVDAAVREVSVDQAIPIGLVTNELVSNAVKHGFAAARGGCVRVTLTGDENARRLVVSDDGSGFPTELDIETSDSLGLKLVLALTEQLGGRFRMERDGGTRCELELPGQEVEGTKNVDRRQTTNGGRAAA